MPNSPVFSIEQLMNPLWDATTIYDERILFVRDKDGTSCAPLLYQPTEILSVTDAERTVSYEENRDYIYRDGKIQLTENSRIFAFSQEELYPQHAVKGETFPMPGGNILYHEGEFFHKRQTSVTYTCVPNWNGIRPTFVGEKLPRSTALLRTKQPINILLFGDSISECTNASGPCDWAPYQPDYGSLLIMALRERYGNDIRYTNTSCGGKDTCWAIETLNENIVEHHPDLAVIAFGMNDGGKSPKAFTANLETIVTETRKRLPDCEFLLVATTLPNRLLTDPAAPFWGQQENFYAEMKMLEQNFNGVAVANVTQMHSDLLARKRFIDLTTNNVNHPNDFLYRSQAQFLFEMLNDKMDESQKIFLEEKL